MVWLPLSSKSILMTCDGAGLYSLFWRAIKCWINGELRQNSNTNKLIFDIPKIIEAISNGITLNKGDVIATGTPSGVGIGFDPPKYLKPGDKTKLEIENIGVLQNPVEAY